MARKYLVIGTVIASTIMLAILAISIEPAEAQDNPKNFKVYESCKDAREAGELEVQTGPNSYGYNKDTVPSARDGNCDGFVCEEIRRTDSDVQEETTEARTEEQRGDSSSSSSDTPGETQDSTESESSTDGLGDDGDGGDAGSSSLGTREASEVISTTDTVTSRTREVHNLDRDADGNNDYMLVFEKTETHSVSTLPYTVVGRVNPLLVDTCRQLWGIGVNPTHVVPVRVIKNNKFVTEGRDYGRPMVDSIGFRHAKYDVCNNSPYDPGSTVTRLELNQTLMSYSVRLDSIEERLTTLEEDYATFKKATQEILNDIVDIIQREVLEKDD